MADYRLIPSRVFLKDLQKIPKESKLKVEKALTKLKKNPHSAKDVKKLASVDVGLWRMRIGDYRLRYDIIDKEVRLHVIRHRKDIYRKR